MPPPTEILIGKDMPEATAFAAEQVVRALATPNRNRSVALAGGSTPRALYTSLASPPWKTCVDWQGIEWFWGDERAVPPNHPDSNYRMARETLLDALAVDPTHIHRMAAETVDLPAAAHDYETTIRHLVPANAQGTPTFDLILLGIGGDGHTASLFPGSVGLTERARLVVAHEIPSLRSRRMTLTFPLLRAARNILFFVTGAAKADILAQIHAADADPLRLPAAGLRTTAGRTIWVLDADAARLVQSVIRP